MYKFVLKFLQMSLKPHHLFADMLVIPTAVLAQHMPTSKWTLLLREFK